jgi:hypothetical protein
MGPKSLSGLNLLPYGLGVGQSSLQPNQVSLEVDSLLKIGPLRIEIGLAVTADQGIQTGLRHRHPFAALDGLLGPRLQSVDLGVHPGKLLHDGVVLRLRRGAGSLHQDGVARFTQELA